MEKNKRYNRSILIPFLVSAYALTVLAHIAHIGSNHVILREENVV